MSEKKRRTARYVIEPVTSQHWPDLVQLFGPRGACGGCWCMWWRLSQRAFDERKGRQNRDALRRLVQRDAPTGLLAFAGDEPVGWCSVAPRGDFPRLQRSRVLKPVDDEPVWSIVCFFVARSHRRQGLTVRLIDAAVKHARAQGARCVEGYPVEPAKAEMPDVFANTGLASAFQRAGFVEVARRSPTRPIMRKRLRAPAKTKAD